VIKPPKTAAGVRSVALPVWLVPELVHHLNTFAESGPDGRVFLGPYGATPLRRDFATIWKQAKAAAGVPADLTAANLLSKSAIRCSGLFTRSACRSGGRPRTLGNWDERWQLRLELRLWRPELSALRRTRVISPSAPAMAARSQ
jgi:hypothetical protein